MIQLCSFMQLALVHLSLPPQQKTKACVIQLLRAQLDSRENLNACTLELSILQASSGDKQMSQWCVDDANVTSAGPWLNGPLVCLTDTAGDDTEMVNETFF